MDCRRTHDFRLTGRVMVSLVIAVASLAVAVPAGASQRPVPGQPSEGGAPSEESRSAGMEITDQRLDISHDPGTSHRLWMWPEARRAYTISKPLSSDQTVIDAFDLDTLRQVGSVTLDRSFASWSIFPGSTEYPEEAMARHAAIDTQGGRMFIPYMQKSRSGGALTIATQAASTTDGVCTTLPCFAGVFVVDLATMTPKGRIPVGQVTIDGVVLPDLAILDLSYSPGTGADDPGKIMVLARQSTTAMLGEANGTLTYAFQLDPDDLKVDWVARVDGCRSVRQPKPHSLENSDTTLAKYYNRRPNEAVIFRGGPLEDRSVWVGCHQPNRTAVVARIPIGESGAPADLPYAPGSPTEIAGKGGDDPRSVGRDDVARPNPTAGQESYPGPKETQEFLADPVSQRILLRVVDGPPGGEAEVWWVFDGAKRSFIGTIGIGRYMVKEGAIRAGLVTIAGVDPSSGRFYVAAPPMPGTASSAPLTGGLFTIDVRRTPVSQALVFPEVGQLLYNRYNAIPIAVDYGDGKPESMRRLFVRPGDSCCQNTSIADQIPPPWWRVVEDRVPITSDPVVDLFAGRTLDLDEVEGVTQSTYDGAARGFAARALIVGGLTKVGRVGPVDPSLYDSVSHDTSDITTGVPLSPCLPSNRQVVLGFVGPRDAAVVDGNGSRGGAEAVVVDSGTRSDAELPVSRCGGRVDPAGTPSFPVGRSVSIDWDGVWSTGLFSRPPVGEPSAPWQFGDGDVSCVSSDESPQDSFGDPVTGVFASKVECGAEEASGYGYARGVGVEDLNVSEAVSKFRIYRDPARGIVSRVESIARGIDIGGVVKIDSVRGVAESWANGRAQFVADADRDAGYDPNCDFERTAGTCFSRSIFGVKTPLYSCGPCGDEQALVEGLSKAMGANGRVRLRNPDETLRKGAPNGYVAAIQKPAYERFGDVVLNDDLLQTVVPVLEIIRYTQPGLAPAASIKGGGRGLQIFQFAGVEVSSSYGIQCLLVYDAAANTCDAGPQGQGGLKVALTDPDGKPLAGGAFEVRRDVDGDGALGLVDELISDGACVTAEDGTGTCSFEGLVPGGYVVVQKAAPAGYAVNSEPFVTQVDAGGVSTVTFVNTSNVSTVQLTVQDEAGKPVSGAVFAVFADADSDGKIAGDAQPAATCTSGPDGTCSMSVPTGAYVLVQQSAPAGLEPIEPVAFVLTSGGQTAAVGVVNYPPELPAGPAAASPAVTYDTPEYPPTVATAPLEDTTSDETVDVAAPSLPEQVGGTIVRVIQAPGDALRLLTRDPKQAAAWTASLLLFALAALAIQRRRQATQLIGR